jgi:hypothetical protein
MKCAAADSTLFSRSFAFGGGTAPGSADTGTAAGLKCGRLAA